MVIGAIGSSALLLFAVLACPLGMGLMMFFMGRGMMSGRKQDDGEREERSSSSLAAMKAEQARLAEKLEALETHNAGSAEPVESNPDRVA